MRAFIYLPDLRASTFTKIPAVPSVSGQGMRHRHLDETRPSRDMSRDLEQSQPDPHLLSIVLCFVVAHTDP